MPAGGDMTRPGAFKRWFRQGPKENVKKKKAKLQEILEDLSREDPNYSILGEWDRS